MPKSQQNASSLERGWGVEPSRRGTQWGDQGTPEPFIFKTDHVLWWKIKCTLLPWIQTPMQRESHHWSWALMVLNFLMLYAVWKKTNHNPPYIASLFYPPIQEGWWIYEREDLDVSPSTPTPTCLNVCQPTPPTPDSPLESPSLQHPPPPQLFSGSIIRSKPTCNSILICQIPSSRRPFSCTLSPSSQFWDWRHNRCQSQWWPVWTTPSSFFSDPEKKNCKWFRTARFLSYLPRAGEKHMRRYGWRKARQCRAPEEAEHTGVRCLELLLEFVVYNVYGFYGCVFVPQKMLH